MTERRIDATEEIFGHGVVGEIERACETQKTFPEDGKGLVVGLLELPVAQVGVVRGERVGVGAVKNLVDVFGRVGVTAGQTRQDVIEGVCGQAGHCVPELCSGVGEEGSVDDELGFHQDDPVRKLWGVVDDAVEDGRVREQSRAMVYSCFERLDKCIFAMELDLKFLNGFLYTRHGWIHYIERFDCGLDMKDQAMASVVLQLNRQKQKT